MRRSSAEMNTKQLSSFEKSQKRDRKETREETHTLIHRIRIPYAFKPMIVASTKKDTRLKKMIVSRG